MVSLFYARHYPAGREANPRSQPVPNGEQRFSFEITHQNCAAEDTDAEMIGLEQTRRFRIGADLRQRARSSAMYLLQMFRILHNPVVSLQLQIQSASQTGKP